jgi:FtsH-binding integral membrane protein
MFQILLIIHIITGTVCLITGLIAMLSKKKRGKHTFSGELYHWAYVIVLITAVVMAIMYWEKNAHLFFIALFSYSFALMGYLAVKKKWKNWLASHIGGMLGSYIGIVTATIVVNIPRIPLLNQLPSLIFWFLPTIIGVPLITKFRKKYESKKELTM